MREGKTDAVFPYSGPIGILSPLETEQILTEKIWPVYREGRKQYLSNWENMMIAREQYMAVGCDNSRITDFRLLPEERFKRMEILGYRVTKVAGRMYSLASLPSVGFEG